jgi:hypothetical protein
MTDATQIDGLIERLNGVYRIPIKDGLGAVGGGDEPDNPNEFVRTFPVPPIHKEAAAALTAERERADKAEAEAYEAIKRFLKAEADRDDLTRKLAEAEQLRDIAEMLLGKTNDKLAEAVEALLWYANPENWTGVDNGQAYPPPAYFDKGDRARAFIAKQEAGRDQ